MKKSILFAIVALLSTSMQAQVTKISSNTGLDFIAPLTSQKALYVSDIDKTLWVTDGTGGGTFKLSNTIHFIEEGTLLNGKYIFEGEEATGNSELYVTDGTTGGTTLLKDIFPGPTGSAPDNDYAILNGVVYFTANSPAEGRELWRTDGTAGGTSLVKDIIQGPEGSNKADGYELFSNGSYLLFTAATPGNAMGEELYKSDGTANGTQLLKDINPGADSSDASFFYKYNNLVLFSAKHKDFGYELWKTDGTPGGTAMISDIQPGPNGSLFATAFSFLSLFEFNGRAYFTANDGTRGLELYSTDGTTTSLLKDINPGGGDGATSFFGALVVKIGNKFIFTATNPTYGTELWQSDGTENGTTVFKDIVAGSESSNALILPPISLDLNNLSINYTLFQGNKFFFVAHTSERGAELYVSDGTPNGTDIVKDIFPGDEDGATITSAVYTSSALFFVANDGEHGEELWKSDGTPAGTTMVANINTETDDDGEQGSDVGLAFYVINNKVVFQANEGDDENNDLYIVDGTYFSLPVTLGEFTVTPKNKDAQLNWSTLTEINTKEFTIERSFEGSKFKAIGTVLAAGNSTQKQTYGFTDKNIVDFGSEIVYYRLLMTDKDGSSTKSKVIALKLTGPQQWNVRVTGNVVKSELPVMLSGVTSAVRLSVKDLTGKTVYSGSSITGSGNINIAIDNLMSGMYVLVAETNNERKVVRFVKQ